MRTNIHEFEEQMIQVIIILFYLWAVLFTELREHAFRDKFLKLKSDLDDCHYLMCTDLSKRDNNITKNLLLYLCTVWSEPSLFDRFFMVNGLVHGILTLFSLASGDSPDEPPHNYAYLHKPKNRRTLSQI